MNPEFIDDGKGGKMLAFKTKTAHHAQPEQSVEPVHPRRPLTRELETMGILIKDAKRRAAEPIPAGGGVAVMLPLIYPAQKRGLKHTTQSALCNNKVCRLERLNLTPE